MSEKPQANEAPTSEVLAELEANVKRAYREYKQHANTELPFEYQWVIRAMVNYFKWQEQYIAALESANTHLNEQSTAKDTLIREARPLLAGSWSLLYEAEGEVRYQHRKHGEPTMASDPLFFMKVKHHLDALQAWAKAEYEQQAPAPPPAPAAADGDASATAERTG